MEFCKRPLEILGNETGENFLAVGIMNGMRDILICRVSDHSLHSPCRTSNVEKKTCGLIWS